MKEVFKACVDRWGKEAQMAQATEECAELIVALNHYRRGRIQAEAVAEEVADVLLMMGQLTYILGDDMVTKAYEKKLLRVTERVVKP